MPHWLLFLVDRYFLINWLEEEDLYDVVSSKSVVPLDDTDILDLCAGAVCKVGFDGIFYKAKVIEYGMSVLSPAYYMHM